MTTPTDPKNLIAITPADQRRAAELIQAAIVCEGEVIDVLLTEAAAEGIDRALAITACSVRWGALALVERHGLDTALRIVESTRLDAAVAEPDEE